MNGKEAGITYALAIGIPALIAFHEYSTYLSSPYTTQKLGAGDGDSARIVTTLFTEATMATLLWTALTAGALSYGMGSWWPLLAGLASSVGVAVWVWYDYSRALKGEL